MKQPRIPTSTYRLQFNREFTFAQAKEIVPYLDALGVSAGQYLKTVKTEPPAQRQKGVLVKDVAELVDVLKKKGLI